MKDFLGLALFFNYIRRWELIMTGLNCVYLIILDFLTGENQVNRKVPGITKKEHEENEV